MIPGPIFGKVQLVNCLQILKDPAIMPKIDEDELTRAVSGVLVLSANRPSHTIGFWIPCNRSLLDDIARALLQGTPKAAKRAYKSSKKAELKSNLHTAVEKAVDAALPDSDSETDSEAEPEVERRH
jgi:hypothetical protein